MSYEMKAVKHCFANYYMAGISYEQIVKKMRADGYKSFSKGTLSAWVAKYGWDDERAKVLDKQQEAVVRSQTVEEETLDELSQIREKIINKIKSSDDVNAQDVHAYNKVSKMILEIQNKDESFDRLSAFLAFWGDFIEYLNNAEDKPALETMNRHFDPFVEHIKGKYGN